MNLFNRAQTQLQELYRSMTPSARLTAGLLLALVLVGLVYLGSQQAAAPEVDLMHGERLSANQLPLMEAAFYKANLKGYKIRGTENKLSIFVPRGQESAYMNALVAAGALPPDMGDVIAKAANTGSLFESESQREQRIKAAREAELAIEIRKMPGIENAAVLYEISKPGGFIDKVVTATVSVKPVGSGRLSPSVAAAIRKHVAGAIAAKPENVTVSDLNIQEGVSQETAPAQPVAASPNVPQDAVSASPAADFSRLALAWAEQQWKLLGAIGLGLIGLLALRRIVRGRSAAVERPAAFVADAAPTAVAPPHWQHRSVAGGRSVREELSTLVEEDPEAAANILRNWIGQGG